MSDPKIVGEGAESSEELEASTEQGVGTSSLPIF